MKKVVLLFFLFAISSVIYAQDISVVSFLKLDTDPTAMNSGTAVLDGNGEKCALIKISTSQTGFSFRATNSEVVKTVQHDNEVWVYVPKGTRHLTVSHDGMETLSNYDLGSELSEGCTYLMILKTTRDITLQTITFKVAPSDASVKLESVDQGSTFKSQTLTFVDGETTLNIPTGKYKYTATLSGYYVEESTLEISASTRKINIELTPISDTTKTAVVPPVVAVVPPAVAVVPPVVAVVPPAVAEGRQTFTVNGVSFDMIEVEGGSFTMGSMNSDGYEDEKPAHSVTLSTFYAGETEVTQELWKAVMGKNPSFWKSSKRPVDNVSWIDCQRFISELNSLTGKEFRLLSEAEWEYAARGGNKSKGYKYAGSDDLKTVAWYALTSGSHPVKGKLPNELGIYDMSGNVYEWCDDWYDAYTSEPVVNPRGTSKSNGHVYRGGSYDVSAPYCRITDRRCDEPTKKYFNLGLRLAL